MFKSLPLTTMALLISVAAFSQENYRSTPEEYYVLNDTVKNKKGQVLQEVIVTANQQKNPVSVGKSGIKPMDLPQATTVVGAAVIETQQINSITDLLKNVNGVYIMGTTGGYQEEIASRGSALSSSNTFKNGVRYFSGMRTEMSGIERAEFLKGSAAILFGNVAPGGVLNLVTKKPKFEFGGEAGFKLGSWNTFKPTFDVYNALNKSKTLAFRVNGAYEKGDSFRNEVHSESFYFNPSFLAKISKKTQLLIEGDFLKDRRTPDFGAGIINYEIVDIPRDRFVGVSWGYFGARQASATATLTHELSSKWNISYLNGIRYYDTDLFSNARPNSAGSVVQPDGSWNRNLQRNEVKDNYYIQQLDLKGNFNTGKIAHQMLFGGDWEKYKTTTTAYYGLTAANNGGQAFYDNINIFQPYNPAVELPRPDLDKNTLTTVPVNRFGVYIQDLVSLNKYVKLLAGVRYTYQDTRNNVYKYAVGANPATNTPTDNYDDAFSPRIGLVIQPSENHSIFASYSNSFQTNTGVDVNGKNLDPSIIDQYEIGIKNKFFDERLFVNITAYQITNSDLAQASLTVPTARELAGETRSNGVEIDLVANPLKGLSVLAGYSFNETKYRKSNIYIEGSELRYNPKNTANFNINYKFETGKLKGLNLGLINSYFGQRYAGRSTRLTIPNDTYKLIPLEGYIQVDATLSYSYKKWSIHTKWSNVFNELNYNIHDDNSLNPIAPRNYSVALNYKF
ncbi:TonB-dependent siderophore receptor [Flavobacterium wongokense]|uniref:TonB-dependent siderophore receptor n=1 Tax=Flavobacterium wongokense TaxID=2910674 RepID=UPI001F41C448|nr:TonB-dependent siderophore receptor [Flavobacterium sp. WG47]MCF6132017.1 TonB-dependent siderophore receptor [Flavobacterium sp. WG47]